MKKVEKTHDLQLLVDETYQLQKKDVFINIKSHLNTIHLSTSENGCYVIKFMEKSLEIPKNWKLFQYQSSKELRAVKDIEASFEMIFNSYFEVEVSLYIGFNDDGPYLILNELRKYQENVA